MHMEVRDLFGRFVWRGVNIDERPTRAFCTARRAVTRT